MRAVDAEHYWIAARLERREGWDNESYPFNVPAVRNLDELIFHPKVTFLVGENGSGKSTLIEAFAMAWGSNAEETDHVQITRSFLNRRQVFLDTLLTDD